MKILVLTGGIACGKTTVAKYFHDKYHITIIDSDLITYQLQQPGAKAYNQIVKVFGSKYINPDQTLNRKELGNLVFHDKSQRKKLNQIVHPLVIRTIIKEVIKSWTQRKKVVILDIPLFFEIKMKPKYFDEVITVSVSPDVQIERLMKRNDLSHEDALSRITSQMPIEIKCELSTVVINNDGDESDFKADVDNLMKKIYSQSQIFTRYPDPLSLLFILLSIVFVLIYKLF